MSNRERFMVAAVLIGLAGMFLAGRWSVRPVTVTEKAKAQEQAKEKTHEHTQAATASNTQATTTATRAEVSRRYRKDGSLVSERVSSSNTNATSATQAQTVEIRWKDRDREVIKTVEVTKVVEGTKPKWHIFASGGVQWTGERLWGGGITRQVWGPFTAGIEVHQRGGALLLGVTF